MCGSVADFRSSTVLQVLWSMLAVTIVMQTLVMTDGQDTEENSCTLCVDGSAPPLEFQSAEALVGFTCEQYAGYVSTYFNLTDEECTVGQVIGSRMCGCPELEIGKNACTLCRDGSKLDDESGSIVIGEMAVCDDVAAVLALQMEATDPSCNIARATVGYACGCAYDPAVEDEEFNICRLCGPPGATLPDPLRVVSIPDFGSPTTCAVWESAVAEAAAEQNGTCAGEFREMAASACCSCSDSQSGKFLTVSKKESDEDSELLGCEWLRAQDSATTELYCSSFGKVRRSCRSACNACGEDESCEDDTDFTFRTAATKSRTCQWVSRKKQSKKTKICKRSPGVRESCKATCGLCE